MSKEEISKEATVKFVSAVAKKNQWVLNPDAENYEHLVEGLNATVNRYGYYLCPCRDSEGSREEDADVICPCKYSAADVAEYGHCFCGLYLTQALAEAVSRGEKKTQSIPERRYLKN